MPSDDNPKSIPVRLDTNNGQFVFIDPCPWCGTKHRHGVEKNRTSRNDSTRCSAIVSRTAPATARKEDIYLSGPLVHSG